jgi:hypothetical protein
MKNGTKLFATIDQANIHAAKRLTYEAVSKLQFLKQLP